MLDKINIMLDDLNKSLMRVNLELYICVMLGW